MDPVTDPLKKTKKQMFEEDRCDVTGLHQPILSQLMSGS